MAVNGEGEDLNPPQEPQPQAGPIEVIQGLRFPCPERFEGVESKFEDFAYSLRSYLSTANPAFYTMMKRIEDSRSTEPINWENLDATQQALSAQLQNTLQARCKNHST